MKTKLIVLICLFLILSCGKEKELFEKTEKTNTIEAYEAFLQKYPKSKYKPKIDSILVELAYEQAILINTIEAFDNYQKKYPASKYSEDINARIDWIKIDENPNKATYEEYIKNNPDSRYVNKANLRIKQLNFWEATQNTRKNFQILLSDRADICMEFHPRYVKYAIDLLRHNLLHEAMAVLLIIQYQNDRGAEKCRNIALEKLKKSMNQFKNGNYYGWNFENARIEVERLTQRLKIMQQIDYVPSVEKITELIQTGEIDIDNILREMLESDEQDEKTQLEKFLKNIEFSYYKMMFPEFLTDVINFLGERAAEDQRTASLLTNFDQIEAARFVLKACNRYAQSNRFKYLSSIAKKYKNEALQLLDIPNDTAKANIIFAFGLAKQKSSIEKIKNYLNNTEDERLKIACYFALTYLGEDNTDLMNNLLNKNLEKIIAEEKSKERESETKSTINNATDIVADILAYFQWLDIENEKKINVDQVKRAVKYPDSHIQFFAPLILRDIEAPLDSSLMDVLFKLLENDEPDIRSNVKELLKKNQKQMFKPILKRLKRGTIEQKVALLEILDSKYLETSNGEIDSLINTFIKGSNTKLVNAAMLAIGNLKLTKYNDLLVKKIDSEDYGHHAFIALVSMNENKLDSIKNLKHHNSDYAILARAILGDNDAKNLLLRRLKSNLIHDILTTLQLTMIWHDKDFFQEFYKKVNYSNSWYAPTDYYVAYYAQKGAISTLTTYKDLRE